MTAIASAQGVLHQRQLADGREIYAFELLFGTAMVAIGFPLSGQHDDVWFYPDADVAAEAAERWDGRGDPPDGWDRHLSSRRRRPGGDPALEYVETPR